MHENHSTSSQLLHIVEQHQMGAISCNVFPGEKMGGKKPHQNKASVGSTQGFVEVSAIGKIGTQEQ